MALQHEQRNRRPSDGREHLGYEQLSADGVANVIAYLEIVRSVLERLLDEGYTIREGKLLPPAPNLDE